MAKSKFNNKQNTGKKENIPNLESPQNSISAVDKFLNGKKQIIFWTLFCITALVTILLFDKRVSVGGDDAAYISRAFDLVEEGRYPTFQGPLYPMILSIIVLFAGINLVLVKSLSLIFVLGFVYLYYKVFENKLSPSVLFSTMILFAVNPFLLYYGSQTYTEALFTFETMLLFWVVFKYFDVAQAENINLKTYFPIFLKLGVVLLIMGLTKTLGIMAVGAVIIYFLVHKYWKSAFFSFVSFGLVFGLWEIIKRVIWSRSDLQFSSQGATLLQKHPYDTAQGYEDLAGFIQRFFDNSNIYLSKHLYTFLGLRPEITTIQPILTIFTYALFFIGLIYIFKRNKFLLFVGIFIAVMLFTTFISLQKMWDSGRLIIAFFPYIVLFLAGCFYEIGINKKNIKIILPAFYIIIFVVFLTTFSSAVPKIKERQKNNKMIKRNKYFGFTPDWVNYIKATEWAAQNLPKDAVIACRKPDISFIWGKRKFYGIYNLPTQHIDSLEKDLSKINGQYFVLDIKTFKETQELIQIRANILSSIIAYMTANLKDQNNNPLGVSMYEIYRKNENSEVIIKFFRDNGVTIYESFDLAVNEINKLMTDPKNQILEKNITNPDLLWDNLVKNKVKYIIRANLRKHEAQKTQYTINTIRRYMYYIEMKYPNKFRKIHQIGDDEEAEIFELMY